MLAAVERRLSNPEIALELFISVRTVESHIASLKRKLGAANRAELIAAAGARRAHTASVRLPQNAFVGRDTEMTELSGLLAEPSWVTIVGPGGVGKTRLALEFASRSERVPVIVELERAQPGDVIARIARELDLEAGPGVEIMTSVALALASHPYLLVLDNIDRVGSAVGEVVARVQATATGLRVLTTSRTPIGDAAETIFPLAPLTGEGSAAAVTMFLDRLGHSAGPPTRAARELIAHVCERLDGLPLAIELAAAVARHLSLEELAQRLNRDFATLDRAVPEGRHRTLETAFEWTWDLLTEEERYVLCRLAALPRTFDVDLAAAVTNPRCEGIMLRLLDHSMLVATGGSPRRFRLLAVMREFIHARTDPTLIREVLEQHAVYIESVTADFVVRARTDDSAAAQDLSAALCPEVNAALRWALAAQHPTARALAAELAIGVDQYGADVDSLRSLAMAARDERVLESATAQQLLLLGSALAVLDVGLVGELAERAMAIVRDSDDDAERLAAHHLAGIADAYGDRMASALAHLDEAERLAASLGDDWELASVHHTRGIALRQATPPLLEPAIAEFDAAVRGYARARDALHVNNARFMLAFAMAETGIDPQRAEQLVSECIAYSQAVGNRHELAHAHLVRARLHADSPSAADDIDALVDAFRSLGDLRCLTRSLLLQAPRARPDSRIAILDEALCVAEKAGNRGHQAAALGALVEAHWAKADRIATLAALDRLGALAGAEAAAAVCPPDLFGELVSETVHSP